MIFFYSTRSNERFLASLSCVLVSSPLLIITEIITLWALFPPCSISSFYCTRNNLRMFSWGCQHLTILQEIEVISNTKFIFKLLLWKVCPGPSSELRSFTRASVRCVWLISPVFGHLQLWYSDSGSSAPRSSSMLVAEWRHPCDKQSCVLEKALLKFWMVSSLGVVISIRIENWVF